MKRFALNLVLGVVLAAGSSAVGATTNNPEIKNNSTTIGSFDGDRDVCVRFRQFCVGPDTTDNPTIKNN